MDDWWTHHGTKRREGTDGCCCIGSGDWHYHRLAALVVLETLGGASRDLNL